MNSATKRNFSIKEVKDSLEALDQQIQDKDNACLESVHRALKSIQQEVDTLNQRVQVNKSTK